METERGRQMHNEHLGFSNPLYGAETVLNKGLVSDGLGPISTNNVPVGPKEINRRVISFRGPALSTENSYFPTDTIGEPDSANGLTSSVDILAFGSGIVKLKVKGWKKCARVGSAGNTQQEPKVAALGKRSPEEVEIFPVAVSNKKSRGRSGNEEAQVSVRLAEAVEQPRQTL